MVLTGSLLTSCCGGGSHRRRCSSSERSGCSAGTRWHRQESGSKVTVLSGTTPHYTHPPRSCLSLHLGAPAQTQLDTPEGNLQVTGGRRAQVDGQLPGGGDLGRKWPMGDRRLPGLQTPPLGLGTDAAAGDANSSMQPSGNLAQRASFLSDHPPCLPRTSSPCQSSPPRHVWMNVSRWTQTREQRPQGSRINGRECPVNW